MGRAHRHVDRRDFVLGLHDEQVVVALLALEIDVLVGRRADRVVALKGQPGLELRDRRGVHPADEHRRAGTGRRLLGLRQLERKVLAEVLSEELGGDLRRPDVHLANLGPPTLEALTHDLEEDVDREVEQRERGADGNRVGHHPQPPSLLLLAELAQRLAQQLVKREWEEAHIIALDLGLVKLEAGVEDRSTAGD